MNKSLYGEIPAELEALFKAHQDKKATQTSPASTNDVIKILRQKGQEWRDDHTKTQHHKDGTQSEITRRVPARTIANYIKDVVITAVIGDTQKETDQAPLTLYNNDTGLYTNSERLLNKMILAVDNTTNKRFRAEIQSWLNIEAPSRKREKDINLIPVGNGVYNKITNKLLPYSPSMVFTSKVATNYNNEEISEPSFNGWKFSEWIKELSDGNKEKEKLLWQLIACVIQNRFSSNVLFCLMDGGQGRTGKSTFEQLLMNLVGNDNYTSLKLEEFDKGFLLAQAFGASLIIGDDNNPKGYIDDGSTLKSIVTNELVLVNPKMQAPFSARFNATIVQSMNGFPRFKDTSGGLYRRFRLIKFNHQYPDTPAGRKIKDEYIYNQQLLEWILKKAINIPVDTIIQTKESQTALDDIQLENDIVLSFVNSELPELKSTRLPVKFLFNLFRKYSDDNNTPTKMSRATFTRRIKPLMAQRGWKYKKRYRPGEYFKESDAGLLKSTNYYDYNNAYKDRLNIQVVFVRSD